MNIHYTTLHNNLKTLNCHQLVQTSLIRSISGLNKENSTGIHTNLREIHTLHNTNETLNRLQSVQTGLNRLIWSKSGPKRNLQDLKRNFQITMTV